MRKLLTKSHYLIGIECPKQLWKTFNQSRKGRRPSLDEDYIFREGIEVGEFAKKLYQDGIDIPFEKYSVNLLKTKEYMEKKKPLFEAGFEFRNCFSRLDILVPVENKWDIIEVKSGTAVKDINIHDMAFQKFICDGVGLNIRNCYLMFLNKDYVKKDKLEPKKLFKKEDITNQVAKITKITRKRIEAFLQIVNSSSMPDAGILLDKIVKKGYHDCCKEKCLELPEHSVFSLHLYRKKAAAELFKKGIIKIADIPEDCKLSSKQKIQKESIISGKTYYDEEKLEHFLNLLHYPLHYLDFETFSTAIPMFEGLYPHAKIPFQFSLHREENEREKLEHYEFLYKGKGDPRKEFLVKLKEVLGQSGSIVVYNKSFEQKRLVELGEFFPKYKPWIESVIVRFVDLIVPFREFSYYNPKQNGRYTIKAILPAITGRSYNKLLIKDGKTAAIEFHRINYEKSNLIEKWKIRNQLLEYCKLDTYAQYLIVEKLKKLLAK